MVIYRIFIIVPYFQAIFTTATQQGEIEKLLVVYLFISPWQCALNPAECGKIFCLDGMDGSMHGSRWMDARLCVPFLNADHIDCNVELIKMADILISAGNKGGFFWGE